MALSPSAVGDIMVSVAILGFTFWLGGSGVAIIAAGGTDLYCHSEPPLTSGKLCFIINSLGPQRARIFTGGSAPIAPFEPPLVRPQEMDRHSITYMYFF